MIKTLIILKIFLFSLIAFGSSSSQQPTQNILDTVEKINRPGFPQQKQCIKCGTLNVSQGSICPDLLIDQHELDQYSFGIGRFEVPSPQQACSAPSKIVDKAFNDDPIQLEAFIKDEPEFLKFKFNPSIAHCLIKKKSLTKTEQNQIIAEYYATLKRLELGLSSNFQDIAFIDLLTGTQILEDIPCHRKHISEFIDECRALKDCSRNRNNQLLSHTAQNTLTAMETMSHIRKEIQKRKRLVAHRRGTKHKQIKEDIQHLEGLVRHMTELYPWTGGSVFKENYKPGMNIEGMERLIKDQLSHTRTHLKKQVTNIDQAIKCLHQKTDQNECDTFTPKELSKILGKTPPLSSSLISDKPTHHTKKLSNLSTEEANKVRTPEYIEQNLKDITLSNHLSEIECRHNLRALKKEQQKDIREFVFEAGMTLTGLGYLKVAKVIAHSIEPLTTSYRVVRSIQRLNIPISNLIISLPYGLSTAEPCKEKLNQFSPIQVRRTKDNQEKNICKDLTLKIKHTSGFKSCLMQKSLAALFIILPNVASFTMARALTRKVESILGYRLTSQKFKAVKDAVYKGLDGKPTERINTILTQTKILKSAGLSKKERRTLMETMFDD